MLKQLFLVTTALVLCVASSVTGRESTPGNAAGEFQTVDRNAQFLSQYGSHGPHNASTLLYAQSASSGFSTYAVPSWKNDSAYDDAGSSSLAADDFLIAGKGSHSITAIYAPGVGDFLNYVDVTFYDRLSYNRKTGTTTAVVKASCNFMPFSMSNGGDLTVDVSSCNAGKFKSGHDYAVSIQGLSPGPPVWAWQTNRKQIGRQAFWYGHNQPVCGQQLTPLKMCFSEKGYGRDLAFAIYGN